MLIACLLALDKRAFGAGAVLGVAALVKFFPAVIAPALYRRWGWRLPTAMLGVIALLYLPYLSVGRQVLGFLPAYLEDEGLTSGAGFFLVGALGTVLPLASWAARAYLLAGAALLGALAAAAVVRRDAKVSLGWALVLLAAFTVWVSPHLPWYFTWALPFVCFKPSWALIYLSAAAPLLYEKLWEPGFVPLQAALYGPFALILALELWLGRDRPPSEFLDDGSLESRHAG
ncbi:MAG: hypothetical protein NVSMB10_15150 [Steroidobacteraceae bacterium]